MQYYRQLWHFELWRKLKGTSVLSRFHTEMVIILNRVLYRQTIQSRLNIHFSISWTFGVSTWLLCIYLLRNHCGCLSEGCLENLQSFLWGKIIISSRWKKLLKSFNLTTPYCINSQISMFEIKIKLNTRMYYTSLSLFLDQNNPVSMYTMVGPPTVD